MYDYIKEIQDTYLTRRAREHTYRPALQRLLESLNTDDKVNILNDSARTEYGSPDFVIAKKDLSIGYIETKDIDGDLDKTQNTEQLKRYYKYPNLILTNYLEFRFIRNGEMCEIVKIGELDSGGIKYFEENFNELENLLIHFLHGKPNVIKNGAQLAKVMGGNAQRIRDNVLKYLKSEFDSEANVEIMGIYEVMKKLLIHDLSERQFADMYAQTLVYGLFIARYHDDTPENFSRSEARDLIPASNPFLKQFFEHIGGANFDFRLTYIVNELCEIFANSAVNELMQKYSKQLALFGDDKEAPDPVIHFYEDFLKEYDPKQRVELGVFYTPLPVVRFIIKAVDMLLRKEFGLEKGLADNSKIKHPVKQYGKIQMLPTHRAQILDPATGTGTFLNEIIKHIKKTFVGQEGSWDSYVERDLLSRLHGFEIMMSSYIVAHLKLGLTLDDTGFKEFNNRLGVYLTNSLEEFEDLDDTLFAKLSFQRAITKEAEVAGNIKNKKPIMVIVGNPPYSGESRNPKYKGNDVYKFEPGTNLKLKERNPKWLNDDYVKFIRLAESFIEKNKDGIIGMITAHGYLDNPTFRGMRWHLAKTFDKIYILDLHGNANKKETTPSGGKDENVFDIKTGVSIILGVKTGSKKQLADVYISDLYGTRKEKYASLNSNSFDTIKWQKINLTAPNYDFAIRDEKLRREYDKGFSVAELFRKYSVGIVTSRDKFVIDMDKGALSKRIREFLECDNAEQAKIKYQLKENQSFKVKDVINEEFNEGKITKISYRPFDDRWIYYDEKLIERTRAKIMYNFTNNTNIGLVVSNINRQVSKGYFFVSKYLTDFHVLDNARDATAILPLQLYAGEEKTSNLSRNIVKRFFPIIGKEVGDIDIFDYVYAVLYSPSYRQRYKEFLKSDFPKIPYPENGGQFKKLAEKGKKLRELHLLESPIVNNFATTYPIVGSGKVEKVTYSDGRVYINDEQYFGGVPEIAWNFYIGGYQAAQKWLKDRIGRVLNSDDIEHYQKMIVTLVETDRIMREIDKIGV